MSRDERIAGNIHYGALYQAPQDQRPRIYLFASEESLQQFEQEPMKHVDGAKSAINSAASRSRKIAAKSIAERSR